MPEISRRALARTVGRGAVATGLLGLAGRGAWQSLEPAIAARTRGSAGLGRELRIGYLPITDASALLVAHEHGLFARSGVPSARPVLFRSWEALAQAFLVGEVDVVHLLMPFALQLRFARRAPVKVVSWGHTNGSALAVLPSVQRTEQLAGTRVAIPYWWSIHSVLTQRLLRSAGLTPVLRQAASASRGTVELVVMAPADMVSALAAGAISGYAVADPFCAVAEVKKIGHVHRFLGDVWREHACCAITVHDSLVVEHPEVVQAITDAVVSAQAWLGSHRPEAGPLLTSGTQFLPQPTPAVSRVFTRQEHSYAAVTRRPGWHGERLGFEAYPHASYTVALVDALRNTVVDGDTSFLPAAADAHAGLVDDSFVRRSMEASGKSVTTRVEEMAP